MVDTANAVSVEAAQAQEFAAAHSNKAKHAPQSVQQGLALVWLDPRNLVEDPDNERGELTIEADPDLFSLSESIRELGVLEPIRVWRNTAGQCVVSSGHRRRAAAILAGVSPVPCVVVPRPGEEERALSRLAANIARREIDDIALARSVKALLDRDKSLTQREVGQALGMSQPQVANLVRLLGLPEEVQTLIAEGKLSRGHGMAFLKITEPVIGWDGKEESTAAEYIVKRANMMAREGWSVRSCEADVKSHQEGQQWRRESVERHARFEQEHREREAARLNVPLEELEAAKQEESKRVGQEARRKAQREKVAAATLRDVVRPVGGKPAVEHLRLAAHMFNWDIFSDTRRKEWGLPSEKETAELIERATEPAALIAWIVNLGMARSLNVDWNGIQLAGGRDNEWANKTWQVNDAIKDALERAGLWPSSEDKKKEQGTESAA